MRHDAREHAQALRLEREHEIDAIRVHRAVPPRADRDVSLGATHELYADVGRERAVERHALRVREARFERDVLEQRVVDADPRAVLVDADREPRHRDHAEVPKGRRSNRARSTPSPRTPRSSSSSSSSSSRTDRPARRSTKSGRARARLKARILIFDPGFEADACGFDSIDLTMSNESSVVSEAASLHGTLSFGGGCVVHPSASLLALAGPLTLGECNVFDERAVLVNKR